MERRAKRLLHVGALAERGITTRRIPSDPFQSGRNELQGPLKKRIPTRRRFSLSTTVLRFPAPSSIKH